MGDLQQIVLALQNVFTLGNLAIIFGGLILGMIVGCIPGLSVTLGIILLLPLTYSFSSPDTAIISLLAVYVGGMYGGSISAITLNTPGTNSAIATTFDGYPLAKKGKVKKALDTSLFASTFGGLFSALLLLVCASFITKLVSKFASVEYFSMAILGISLIAGVSGDSLPKGIMSGLLGILMAAIGADAVTGVMRFTFGIDSLRYGIDMLPAMIALIALTQVVQKLRDFVLAAGKLDDVTKIDTEGLTLREAKSIIPACTRSSAIASILGAMPGVGGGVAQFMCYNECRRASKRPQDFGKGSLEGIAAAEASNNAVVGSAMIPLLTLGIPGDGVTALLLGAFILHGIQPGPHVYKTGRDCVFYNPGLSYCQYIPVPDRPGPYTGRCEDYPGQVYLSGADYYHLLLCRCVRGYGQYERTGSDGGDSGIQLSADPARYILHTADAGNDSGRYYGDELCNKHDELR